MELVCENKKIILDLRNENAKSVSVSGRSRMGKSYFVSNLVVDLKGKGHIPNVIDFGEKWSEADKKRFLSAGATEKIVATEKIFLKFGTVKELIGCAKMITDALGFQSREASAVLERILSLLNSENEVFGMSDVLDMLEDSSQETGEERKWSILLFERLKYLDCVMDICFCVNENAELSDMSIYWNLSGLGETNVQLFTSLFLYCLYCQKKQQFKNGSGKRETFVVMDEVQNLAFGRKSIIGTCLTEGQKYGLNLILITQFLQGNYSEAVITQFKQGGFRFYFRLTEEEARIVSRQLVYDISQQKVLYQKLISLPRGKCLLVGPHFIEGRTEISEALRFVEIIADKCEHIDETTDIDTSFRRSRRGTVILR